MKRNILGLFAVLTAIVGCGYFYSAQEATLPTETPVVNRYMDKENPPKGIRKSLEHVMKMWTNMGELEYSDELYSNMIKSADALKQANNPNKTTMVTNPTIEWEELGPNNVGGRTRSILIDRDNNNRVYAAGVTGGVYISNNGGNSWEPYAFNEELGTLTVGRIIQTQGGSFFISTGEPRHRGGSVFGVGHADSGISPGVGIYRIDDWNAAPVHLTSTANWSRINHIIEHPSNANQLYAVLDQSGGVFISSDNGNSWSDIDANLSGQGAFDLRFSASGNEAYLAYGTRIYKSSNGGVSFTALQDPLLDSNGSRRLIATSPTENDVVYTVMTTNGSLDRVAKSTDAGATWTEIAPGGTAFLDIFGAQAQGWYDACLIVDPVNPNRIFVGGVTLWSYSDEDGWIQLNNGNNNALNPYYVHPDIHTFTFHPTNPNLLYIGTDGGVFKTENADADNPTFYASNFGYNVTQFYSVGASRDGRVLGGTQDNSTPYMDYSGYTAQQGEVLFGGDGTYAEISHIVPSMVFLGSQNNNMRRSNNYGETNSSFTDHVSGCGTSPGVVTDPDFVEAKSHFISPFLLWENVEEYWDAEDTILTSTTIEDKEAVLKKLRRANYFMGVCNKALMSCVDNTVDVLNPGGIVTFNDIASTSSACTAGSNANPASAFAVDHTGKYVLIGFPGGQLRRVVINWTDVDYPNDAVMIDDDQGGSRIQTFEEYILGFGTETASGLPVTAFEWNESFIYGTNPISGVSPWGSGYINGINFDPNDNTRAILGIASFSSAGNKVFLTQNATSTTQVWQPLPGLPDGMPVYDVVLGANPINFVNDYAYAATELGVWGYSFSTNTWAEENVGIGRVRTFRIRQELLRRKECMAMYIGTHGRGIHRSVNLIPAGENCDVSLPVPVTSNVPQVENSSNSLSINVYPNPVSDNSKVDFELSYNSEVTINVLSIEGKVIISENLGDLSEGRHFFNINASEFATGNYIVNLVTEKEIVNSKFTVGK